MIEFNQTLYAFDFFVKLNFIRLHNFRNVELADVGLDSDSVWIHGRNGQGKTNLLEAVGMLNAMRSFRNASADALVRRGFKSAGILAQASLSDSSSWQVELVVGEGRAAFVDGQKISKLSEFIGRFPVLAITNEDLRLLRGAPEARRRDMDMFISSLDADYFECLRLYYRALSHRNALLKDGLCESSLLESFEISMACNAEKILSKRKSFFEELGERATQKYAVLAGASAETAQISLKPNCDAADKDSFLEMLKSQRRSDIERRSTQRGIHRDDFKVLIGGAEAKIYASEGQQKSAVIALKLAQFETAKEHLREEPVMLFDDVLGELDAERRERFWSCTSESAQILATSTEPPPQGGARNWKSITATSGEFIQ